MYNLSHNILFLKKEKSEGLLKDRNQNKKRNLRKERSWMVQPKIKTQDDPFYKIKYKCSVKYLRITLSKYMKALHTQKL